MFIQTGFRQQTNSSFCGTMSPDVPALLAHTCPSAVSLYTPNSEIFAQGERAGPLYLVEFGTVRICRLTADGRRQISAFHFAGEVFGFEYGTEHHFYAESVDSSGIRVLRPKLDDMMADAILPLALKSLTRAQEHLLVLGRQNGAEKMAAFLLDLADRQGNTSVIDFSMQRNDIADYLGLSFETVSRILTRLKLAKIISIPHVKQIEMLDIEALEDLRG
jgi:CRP/FNR family nitrogen fixation transcriptional regulator